MATPLVEAHIRGEKRLREIAILAVTRGWRNLPAHNEANLAQFFSAVLPVVQSAKRSSVVLTAAYLARAAERQPEGLDVDDILSRLRNGVPAEEVYRRPFIGMWQALGEGQTYADAFEKGLARAVSTAAMDVQLAMRGTAEALDTGYGYVRVADGNACAFCQEVDGAYVKGEGYAMALHNNCGCSLEPLSEPHEGAVFLPNGTKVREYQYGALTDTVAVHEHGELGAVLTAAGQNFTSEQDI